ncbi:MAG: hypothetical protein RIG61_01170 [Deltaproteobacteria bacterium]
MRSLIALITLLAGLPGLAGIYLLYKLGNLPAGAVIIVVNAVVFRGICGTAGGMLLLKGKRAGYYLTAIVWIYLVTVSFMTIIQLYNKGVLLDPALIMDNFTTYEKALAWAAAKIIIGLPVLYWVLNRLYYGRLKR